MSSLSTFTITITMIITTAITVINLLLVLLTLLLLKICLLQRYLTQGIPVVLSVHLVPFCIGLYYSGRHILNWFALIVINLFVYR